MNFSGSVSESNFRTIHEKKRISHPKWRKKRRTHPLTLIWPPSSLRGHACRNQSRRQSWLSSGRRWLKRIKKFLELLRPSDCSGTDLASPKRSPPVSPWHGSRPRTGGIVRVPHARPSRLGRPQPTTAAVAQPWRSEERRVGK